MLARYLPVLDWGRRYDGATFGADLVAACIVTLMLIPQSLAYAMLAGMPPETGLYASILPLVLYGIFGTSGALAVGPAAVTSLMTAAAVGKLAAQGTPEYLAAGLALAALSGLMLAAMGLFRLGAIANFLSHPVVAGFMTASGLLIAASQMKHILGVRVAGDTLPEIADGLWAALPQTNLATLAVGSAALGWLVFVRRRLRPLLAARGVKPWLADLAAKTGPVAAVLATAGIAWLLGLDAFGVALVGAVPSGLPPFSVPPLDPTLWASLAVSALLISVVGFVESVSVAQTFAAKRRQRIDPDQELVALGAANMGAAFSGGLPVTGGFSRSVVNFDAGARTPAAGAFTALGILAATLTLTPVLAWLPTATLAATIIVAVLTLVDLGALRRTWGYSKGDAAAMAATIVATLGLGVEGGILAGVGLSVAIHMNRTARPHVAELGQVPGTEHFRNIRRHRVVTDPAVLSLRIDESLYFPNARFLEDCVLGRVAANPAIRHVVLNCPAVNGIDSSALESLEAINARLASAEVKLHLSEVKGPVMDRLRKSHFLDSLSGEVHLTQFDAMTALSPDIAARTRAADRVQTARDAA